MKILGISCYYHDAAAALVVDGEIVAAAQEERFSRKKHDDSFPAKSVAYCLREGGIDISDVDIVAFYDKPFLKFERILESYVDYAPHGYASFMKAMPVWLKDKFWMQQHIEKKLGGVKKLIFTEHHQSHAASAFFPSPFEEATVLTVDGVGEWTTASWGIGKGNTLEPKEEIIFPHSLGLLYSAFTYYTGFKVNSGEYKVMGLAPYGEPKYTALIYRHLIDVKEDGSFRLNMEYFNYVVGLTMTNEKFHTLFGGPPRKPESPLTQKEMDIAASLQVVTEEIMLRIVKHVYKQSGMKNLCLAGGVALNCVANGRILREGPFEEIWIQPAAGDAGGAIGAALSTWYEYLKKPRVVVRGKDSMKGALLGPSFTNDEIKTFLTKEKAEAVFSPDKELFDQVAGHLENGMVVGWFQGRMEFGPRALGGRSILGDARNKGMQSKMNLKIKYRESFRPFAPSVLAEKADEYFELGGHASPYMLLTAFLTKSRRREMTKEEQALWGIAKLNATRSDPPAITHVDYSARVQTVSADVSPRYHSLLKQFEARTGCAVLVNTSFNVRGEPIVCTPEDAYRCFMRTDMDILALGNYVLEKTKQPKFEDKEDWGAVYALD
ncbi:MAG: carbamoyltransferase [bacterium]|nr:carbamoyltransferase [bacterium]